MRNAIASILAVGALLASIGAARWLRDWQDAEGLAREAVLSLRAPLERVSELSRLPATRAIQLLERAVELHEAPELQARLAWAHSLEELQKGRLPQARRAFKQANVELAGTADLLLLDAALSHAEGHEDVAEKRVQALLARDRDNVRAQVLAADLAADRSDRGTALAALERLIAKHPQVGPLYNRRGLLHEAQADHGLALADFERAIALDPALPQPHINLGRVLRAQGKLREAEDAFAQALEHGLEPDALLGRGLCRFGQGDVEGARIDVEQARELAPAEPGPLVALADLDVQAGELASAIERYRAALVLEADDAIAWLKLGNALMRSRRLEEARPAYERAVALAPDLGAAHNGLGAVLMGLGDDQAAEQALATAAVLDVRDPNPLLNLALLRSRHGDARGAADARERALARRAL